MGHRLWNERLLPPADRREQRRDVPWIAVIGLAAMQAARVLIDAVHESRKKDKTPKIETSRNAWVE